MRKRLIIIIAQNQTGVKGQEDGNGIRIHFFFTKSFIINFFFSYLLSLLPEATVVITTKGIISTAKSKTAAETVCQLYT